MFLKTELRDFPSALVETGLQPNEVRVFPVYDRDGAVNIHTISLSSTEINPCLSFDGFHGTTDLVRFKERTLTSTKNLTTPNVIVFDLGGVMAEISHSWEEAAAVAGVVCSNLKGGNTKLASFHAFDLYQASEVSLVDYLFALAEFVGCDSSEALKVHNGILVVEYPGVGALVDELQERGFRTGCLSNTNEPHWEVLALNGQYPAIHSLEMKMASHLVGINKPSHAIFERYCAVFGLKPNQIAFFDDGPLNVEAASACGWNAHRIDPSQDTPTQMRAYLMELGVI